METKAEEHFHTQIQYLLWVATYYLQQHFAVRSYILCLFYSQPV